MQRQHPPADVVGYDPLTATLDRVREAVFASSKAIIAEISEEQSSSTPVN
jgi:hypothetical protein